MSTPAPRLPFADRLRPVDHVRTSAGTQDFDSVGTRCSHDHRRQPRIRHPVFASRLKKRLRQGAKLIVVDPRRTEMVESLTSSAASAADAGHQRRRVDALAHVIVTEGLVDEALCATLRLERVRGLGEFRCRTEQQPEAPRS